VNKGKAILSIALAVCAGSNFTFSFTSFIRGDTLWGVIMLIVGLNTIGISVYTLFHEEKTKEMTGKE